MAGSRGVTVLVVVVMSSWLAASAFAETSPYASAWHPNVETDVGDPIIFRGFQIGVGVRPGGPGFRHHLRLRALFVHQVIPSFFVDFDPKDKGWGDTVNLGVLTVDYFFRAEGRGGLHVTPSVAFARSALTPPDGSPAARESRLNLVAGAAYQWFPFAHNGFYLQPWAFLIISPVRLTGTSTTNGQTFHDSPVIPALELQVGYEL